jgi:class 3 adenylate cyclase/tetratricopeptide (TPR) repeat protein
MREDIKQWLHELGLDQYAEAFARNNIDFAVIGDLSERDLRELGVTLGHRKILLKAIADHAARAATASEPPATVSAPERRQLTVMFCDLVNSTGLTERYDPEVVKDITAAFRGRCEMAVKRFGGNVAGFRGDGLLVYFGYPEANEHDPERAVRAGLEIAKGVRELKAHPGVTLECRIGIATGEVVVGDAVGSELTRERDVTGVVPNLAARLQQLAEPSTVVVSDVTRWLVGDLFEYSQLEGLSLRGFANRQRVWRVDGESLVDNRFAATHPTAELAPLVGREQELAKLLHHWKLARRGHGQAVLLLGEPGIGKSRMAHSLLEEVLENRPNLFRCFCVEHHKNTALFPVTSLLERLARFERGDSPAAKLDKLDQLLKEPDGGSADVAPLYATLLSIPTADRYPALNLTADLQKERTLAALESQLRNAAGPRTVLLTLEDMHWSDPTTQELVERILQWLPDVAILLLMTARPEFAANWARSDKISTLTLQRLSHDKSLDLVSHVSSHHVIPREILWEIVAKSDGIPLYLEEITKAVLERDPFKNGDAPRGMVLEIKVPNTLQDSLAARLDKLPSARRVAQVGATIGRQFTYELLAAVCPLSKKEILQALDHLTAADLLSSSGTIPNAVYTFKHALLQDWAYENQLKTERSKLHKSIAQILEEHFPDDVSAQPQVLAHHYSKAGEYRQAIGYWQKAAKRSADQAAYTEALKHLSHAFDHLDRLDDDRQRDTIELELRVARGLSLERTMGYGAPEIKETYERARELCQKLGETVDMVPVLLGLYVFHLVRAEKADLVLAHELAQQCVQLSKASGRFNYLIDSYAALGYVLCYLGSLEEAREVLEAGVGLYEWKWGELEFAITAQDPAVASLALLGVVLWLLGRPDDSLKKLNQSFALADRLGQPINHAVAYAHAAQLFQLRGETERAAEYAQKGIAVAKENGYPSWEVACSMHFGIAKALLGDATYGIGLAKKCLELWRTGGAELNRPYFLCGIAQGEIAAGRADEALAHLAEALAHAERTGEVYFVPLLHQIRGDYHATLPDGAAAAATDLQRAREIAKAQHARMFELRALRGLCGLRSAERGKMEHLTELAQLVKDLGDAGDTQDLRDAKALCG